MRLEGCREGPVEPPAVAESISLCGAGQCWEAPSSLDGAPDAVVGHRQHIWSLKPSDEGFDRPSTDARDRSELMTDLLVLEFIQVNTVFDDGARQRKEGRDLNWAIRHP